MASGAKTSYYFDLRRLNGDARGLHTVARVFYRAIKELGQVRSVGGLESGSIPIAAAISHLSYINDPSAPINSFYVRKSSKKYGTMNRIEGLLESPAVIVEDVVTSGMSAASAATTVKKEGCECKTILSIIFRGSRQEQKKIEQQYGLWYALHEDDVKARLQG